MRSLCVLIVVATILTGAVAQLIDIPEECQNDASKLASIISIWGKCTATDKSVDKSTCAVLKCDGVKESDAENSNCTPRNELKYSCDLTGKHTKKLVNESGCFTCDYASPVVNGSLLTTNEKCPILQLPKCAAGVTATIVNGCPNCRKSNTVSGTSSSSSCTSSAISACAQRLGSSLKYCSQSTKATVDSSCCPSCKPVCQGAASPYELDDTDDQSHVRLTAHSAWRKLKSSNAHSSYRKLKSSRVVLAVDNKAQYSKPVGWPTSVSSTSDYFKCSGGGSYGSGSSSGSSGGGGGGGNSNGGGGGGGSSGNGDSGSGNSGGDSSDSDDTNNGGDDSSSSGDGSSSSCTSAQTSACQSKLTTMATCASGVSPTYDASTCCIDCRPDNSNSASPSSSGDIKTCSDDEVYECQLKTGFCEDTEPQIGSTTMCCKSCRRAEDACSPMEVAKYYYKATACGTNETSQHLDGQCGPTCVPAKSICSPACKSDQLCLAQTSGSPACVDAYQTNLVIKNGGSTYLTELAAMPVDEGSYYLREVASRYCEIPQVNDECVLATKSIASLEVTQISKLSDTSVQMIVLMKGDVNNNDPTSLLVSSIQRKFAIAGDSADSTNIKVVSIVQALPTGSSSSSSTGIIAGVAVLVVLLLSVAGFFAYRRYQANSKKQITTTNHIEMATNTTQAPTTITTQAPTTITTQA
jgi:hypothetical protein